MNKNKIIFAILWLLLLVWITLVLVNINKKPERVNNTSSWTWALTIWIVADEKNDFQKVIDDFKQSNKEYTNKDIKLESFSSFEDYSLVLTNAIISWTAPDIFVLNNNEKNPIFWNQTVVLDNNYVNASDFRKRYKWVFADDLIISAWEWELKKDYLIWIPVWYETLWVYYNRRYIKASDLENISTMNNKISELKKDNPDEVTLWMWNWSTVYWASDIITQFFMLEKDIKSIKDVTWSKQKQSLSTYMLLWDETWDNAYNTKYDDLILNKENNLDLFSKWEVSMVVWYPSMIKEIDKRWYSKNFLLASAFPHYAWWWWTTLINYNYFVLNKDIVNNWSKYDLANKFLAYLSSDNWAKKYLSSLTYYLPALLSLESDKIWEKISDKYNIVLWDFINDQYELSSFDKWLKNIYDVNIIKVLDNFDNYEKAFETFSESLLCKTNKAILFKEFSKNCD